MPELPDVEGYRRTLARYGSGHRIEQVQVLDPGVLHGVEPDQLAEALSGHRFRDPDRHGKWLLARTDGPTVLLHFGMTGELRFAPAETDRHPYDRVVFRIDGGDPGELIYRDLRKLQGLRLAVDEPTARAQLADLGPDALALDRAGLDALLTLARGALKPLLLDQHRIAGLGNLTVDEILWRARLHPKQPAARLDQQQQDQLYEQLQAVLRESVPAGAVPAEPGWLNAVRGDPAGRCPRCGTPLSRGRISGRTALWCPRCQPDRSSR